MDIFISRTNSFALFLFVFLAGSLHAARPKPLSEKIHVESRLPAYFNTQKAIFVLERFYVEKEIDLELTFRENRTGQVPAPPLKVSLSGPNARHEEVIDISSWPDGEYKVTIAESGNRENNGTLVRAIRKQTVKSPTPPDEPITMDGIKMLFFDDWYIESSTGITKKVNPSRQIPIEPWKNDKSYARNMTSVQNLWFNNEGTMFVELSGRDTVHGESLNYCVKSKDLKNWDVVDGPDKARTNNVVDLGHPRPETKGNRTFRHYDQDRDGEIDLSQVHVRWSGLGKDIKWGQVKIPGRSRIAVWEKDNGESLILGKPITTDNHLFEPDEIGTWSDSNDNFGAPRLSCDGKVLRCFQSRLIPRHDPFRIHYDNMLCDRIMVTWSTTNGINWKPTFFDVPTLDDPPATQHYGVDMWWEENKRLELAYHRIYDAKMQRVSTELAYSRDGISWKRIERGVPFLDNGKLGEWNFGYAITTGNRIRLQGSDGYYYEPMTGINVLHFMFLAAHNQNDRTRITADYYKKRFGGRVAGEKGVQTSPIWNWYGSWEEIAQQSRHQRITPGLMRYRADGWVGATPVKCRGYIKSKALTSNCGLRLNAKTAPDGFVTIEVFDEHGNFLSDYSGPNAARFTGDSTSAELSWSQGKVTRLPVDAFRLFITLEKSELYTLQF
ncbi:MAG: hypothetical protein JXM70_21975 [Pirellulales bacterium]|nr:hypothetical protein [Pirellulales bacterium]